MLIDTVAIELIISFSCQRGDGMGIHSTKQKSNSSTVSWLFFYWFKKK
jgi:hypothetical protein